jgi:ADP-ribosyl-[dinitrogen reductase] hydrolase
MQSIAPSARQAAISGCLLGCALGDALGLPYEGLTAQRAKKILGAPNRLRLIMSFGLVSDDTEHSCLIAQSYLKHSENPTTFQRYFATQLKWWLLALPAGVGLSTSRAIIKLWFGYPPQRSGIYSAGNGAAMRVAVLGVCINDIDKLMQYAHDASIVTHRDPKAIHGAQLIALISHYASHYTYQQTIDVNHLAEFIQHNLTTCDVTLSKLINQCFYSVKTKESTLQFANTLGLNNGVTGYVYDTIPIALHAFLSHQGQALTIVQTCILCGGDTDTVAAIAGSLAGAHYGEHNLPLELLNKIIDFPKNTRWIKRLANELSEKNQQPTSSTPITPHQSTILNTMMWPLQLIKNLCLLIIVLCHGLRRLLPPY